MGKQRQKVRFHFSFSNPIFFKKIEISCTSDYVVCHVLGYGSNVYRMGQAGRTRTVDETAHLGCMVLEGNLVACVGGDLARPAEWVSESFDKKLGGNSSKTLALERAFNLRPGESLVKRDNGKP